MKKISMIGFTLALAMLITVPAMALDTTFSGEYRVRGFLKDSPTLRADDAGTTHMDARIRVKTEFKISDDIKLVTRFDALDNKVWGLADHDNGDKNNIDFDRAYINFKTKLGIFEIGRMQAKTWGNKFADAYTDRDRIKYILPLGDLTVVAVYGKKISTDHDSSAVADGDYDGYSLAGVYKMKNGVTGLLLHLESNMTDIGAPAGDSVDKKEFFVNPFVDITIMDNIKLLGELKYQFGEWDYDNRADDDIARFAANIEATAGLGAFSVTGGYAYVSGDANGDADNEQTWFMGGVGGDWDRIWILTNNEDRSYTNLGGLGNLTDGSNPFDPNVDDAAARYGAKIAYLGGNISPMEGLDVGLLVALSKAEDVPAGWSDEHGMEWDLTLSYKIYDNLSYNFIAAFLAAGDFWKRDDPSVDLENTYSLYQQLKLKF